MLEAFFIYLDGFRGFRISLLEGSSQLDSLIALIVGRVSGFGSSIYFIRVLAS